MGEVLAAIEMTHALQQNAHFDVPENIQNAKSLEDLPQEHAIVALAALCNLINVVQACAPYNVDAAIDTHNPKDVRYLESVNREFNEYKRARIDPVTGYINLLGLQEWCNLNYNKHENSYGIFVVDLISFKNINDTLGHAAGNKGLKQAADFISSLIRTDRKPGEEIDEKRIHKTGDVLSVARTGGDEFVFIMNLNGLSDEEAAAVMLRVETALSNVRTHVQNDRGRTAGFGYRVGSMLSHPSMPLDPEIAIDFADAIMMDKRTEDDR